MRTTTKNNAESEKKLKKSSIDAPKAESDIPGLSPKVAAAYKESIEQFDSAVMAAMNSIAE